MSSACTSEPISHLRLERYVLQELPDGERARVDAHLSGCPACRACLLELRASEVVLRPLSQPLSRPAAELPPHATPAARGPGRRLAALGSGLALAAAALLGLRALLTPSPTSVIPPAGPTVKGGALALELVRERAGDVARDPRSFADGDRFAVRVTCPPARAHFELVVYQAGEAFFPLPAGTLECGNLVPLPGAFQLTGRAPASVCVVLAEMPLDRAQLAHARPESLPEQHACTTVASSVE